VNRVEVSAAEVGRADHVESTINAGQGWKFGIRVVSSNVKGTGNSLERFETSDSDEIGVVGNLEASYRGQRVHGDVVQGRIGNESKHLPDIGEVRCEEGLEEVLVEAQSAVDSGQ